MTWKLVGAGPASERWSVMQRPVPHIEAVERLRRLRPPFPPTDWRGEQFKASAIEGKRRWSEAEELFGAQWPMFADAVAVISPTFGLESRYGDVAAAAQVPPGRNVDNRIALWFLKWARCPTTAGYLNPYDPWLSIWENGGSFGYEHGQFIDVFDHVGELAGALFVRRA